MYTNSAYLHNSLLDIVDKSRPLIVTSCGTYKLYTQKEFTTYRPKGRKDYQLIYVAAGKAHFEIDGKDMIACPGNVVIYRPRQMQRYVYYGDEHTEVFWVHFTGGEVKQILRRYGIDDDVNIFYGGDHAEYRILFKQMIQELQLCRDDYEEMLEYIFRQILISVHRQQGHDDSKTVSAMAEEMDRAAAYFSEHYNEGILVEDYASMHNMSVSWFIRNFRQRIGTTPTQYIMSKRIANAQMLLESSDYNMTEIAKIVGYDNPLYFSRVFKKEKGMSPMEYRKSIRR